MTTRAERQISINNRITDVEQDFYAPLLGITILHLFPEKSDDEIVDAVLSAYKLLQSNE